MSEVCPKCGSKVFVIARDMTATRHCACGQTWLPKLKEENKTVFEVGDIVEWCGVKGVIKKIKKEYIDDKYPLLVNFEQDEHLFTENGHFYDWHLEPSLKLIEKASRKVKKKFWLFIHESEIDELYLEAATLYTMKPNKNCKNCHLVELELEVEE